MAGPPPAQAKWDAILQAAWAPIYEGNATDHRSLVVEYLAKYREHVFIAEPQPLQDIKGPRLLEELRRAKASAASWDQWEHEEWAEFPLEAVEWLAPKWTTSLLTQWTQGFC